MLLEIFFQFMIMLPYDTFGGQVYILVWHRRRLVISLSMFMKCINRKKVCIWGVESGVSQFLFLRVWFKSEQSNYIPQLVAFCQPVGWFLLSIFHWENTPCLMLEECSLLWWDTAFLPCATSLLSVGQLLLVSFADRDQEWTHFFCKEPDIKYFRHGRYMVYSNYWILSL